MAAFDSALLLFYPLIEREKKSYKRQRDLLELVEQTCTGEPRYVPILYAPPRLKVTTANLMPIRMPSGLSNRILKLKKCITPWEFRIAPDITEQLSDWPRSEGVNQILIYLLFAQIRTRKDTKVNRILQKYTEKYRKIQKYTEIRKAKCCLHSKKTQR